MAMASSSTFSILSGTLNHSQWVLKINELVQEPDLDEAALQTDHVSVFQLPESIRGGDNPAAYLPRRVAFGPYHHFRPELYKMDLFKLGKAKNLKWGPQLHQLADQLKPLELRIRACFDQSIEMDGETLSWVLLIDGLFLFELLQIRFPRRRPLELPLQIFHGKLSSEFEIVCDMLKLENQIPFFVLEEILRENHEYLTSLIFQFSASVSPFELPTLDLKFSYTKFGLPQIYYLSHHLLHYLYFLVLLIPDEAILVECCAQPGSMTMVIDMDSSLSFLNESLEILGYVVNLAFIQPLKETYGLIQRLVRLLGSLTTLNLVDKKKPALIPSASHLRKAGVSFKSTKNGIVKCRFDETTLTLTLPSIHLDGFSQVLLRNLVAFEVMAELNPPCLIQYIALMNGLLTNSKDLKILEEAEVVHNHLNSEEEAVELFNGVNNSTCSFNKASVLDIHLKTGADMEIESEFVKEIMRSYDEGLKGMVEKINRSYEKCWSFKKKKFASVAFKYFAILIIVFLVVLVVARFLCSYFSCPVNIFKATIATDVINLRMFDYI